MHRLREHRIHARVAQGSVEHEESWRAEFRRRAATPRPKNFPRKWSIGRRTGTDRMLGHAQLAHVSVRAMVSESKYAP